jgi:hypothetical protein
MRSTACVLISVDRLQMLPPIADALEGIAPGVVVTTRPCERESGMRSSAPYRGARGIDEAGDSFVLQIKTEGRDVFSDVESVLGQWAARHPLSMRFRLFSEW